MGRGTHGLALPAAPAAPSSGAGPGRAAGVAGSCSPATQRTPPPPQRGRLRPRQAPALTPGSGLGASGAARGQREAAAAVQSRTWQPRREARAAVPARGRCRGLRPAALAPAVPGTAPGGCRGLRGRRGRLAPGKPPLDGPTGRRHRRRRRRRRHPQHGGGGVVRRQLGRALLGLGEAVVRLVRSSYN